MGSRPSTRIASRGRRAARPGGGAGAGGRNRPRDPHRKLVGRYGMADSNVDAAGCIPHNTVGKAPVHAMRSQMFPCPDIPIATSR
jgi:hypothetical protein